MTLQELEQQFNKLKQDFDNFKRNEYAIHQHADADGTNRLRKTLSLDQDQVANFGSTQHWSKQSFTTADGKVFEGIIETGPQMLQTTAVQVPNMRVVSKFFELVSSDIDEFYGQSAPLVFPYANTSLTVTAAGNTVTINGYNFTTNSLSGAIINIYDSSGDFVESQVISSNTSTVITITDTWVNTTNSATFKIYSRVALGSTENVWQRVHVWTGSSGGIWFGPGPNVQGQVSTLFVNPTTYDLIYAYPFGFAGGPYNLTATAAAVEQGSGVSDTFTTADAKTVTVTDGIITSIV